MKREKGRLLRWISASTADTAGRLLLQVGATILFARWLGPEVFGQAALIVAGMSVLSILVSAPFEEALTQRKRVTRAHFGACMTLVLAASALLIVLLAGGVSLLEPRWPLLATLAPMLIAFSLILFAEACIALYTALARRHRAFERVAAANLSGQLLGTTVGIALVYTGFGVWGLLAVRFVGRFASLAWLILTSPVRIAPGRELRRVRELGGFAGWFFADRCLERFSDAAFHALIARYFGLEGAGYLNMANRVIEPLRGATTAIGHNISMSYFSRAQDDRDKLGEAVIQAVSNTSVLLLPMYLGLAACSGSLMLVLAGPGWDSSATLLAFFALAAAVSGPGMYIHSGLAARGRSDLGFAASAQELLLLGASLMLLAPMGLVAAGLARLVASLGDFGFTQLAARRVLGLRNAALFRPLLTLALTAGCMAVAVWWTGWTKLLSLPPLALLCLQLGVGIAVFAGLALLLHRRRLSQVLWQLKK